MTLAIGRDENAIDAHVVVRRRGFTLDAELSVDHGEVLAVMGPSGAGKSTLLEAIAGTVRLTGGAVTFDGRVTATPRRNVRPQRRGVVLLGQDARLFPHLNARDNVAFGLRVRGLDRAHARTEADEWLWHVGLGGCGDRLPRTLSGGQQQRVAIARALAAAPRALLLDEPLTSLDPETAGDIRAMLQTQLAAARVATIVVTHDVADAAALARRLILLETGRITQQGPVREVLQEPVTPFGAAIAGLNRVLGSARDGEALVPSGQGRIRLGARWPTGAADDTAVAALFRPAAVRIERAAQETWTAALRLARDDVPEPGEWVSRVVRFEATPSGARVLTSDPAVAAEVPADRLAELRLAPGDPVRLSVRPHDVRIVPVRAQRDTEPATSPDPAAAA